VYPILGKPIVESGPLYPDRDAPSLADRILTLGDDCFTVANLLKGYGYAVGISETWFAANCPVAFPFILNESITVYQLGWYNGGSVGDNIDIGIYDTSWNRLVSAGSTAASGAGSSLQFVNVADTLLVPGTYYLAKALDTITANRSLSYANGFSTATLALAGVMDSSTAAFPLPNPLTNMTLATTVARITMPLMATRALV